MAINFQYDATQYEEKDYSILPEGDYRVRINGVQEKTFRSGNEGFEVTLEVNGSKSRLWYYLVIDVNNPQQTNQRLGAFFDSFGITNHNLASYKTWVGKMGAVRVKHEEWKDSMSAKVAYCVSKQKQKDLPAWVNDAQGVPEYLKPITVYEDEIPF